MEIDKEVLANKMELGEFKEYCRKFDTNITEVIPENKFKTKCMKCGSLQVQILHNGKQISQGSEYTGCWTSQDLSLVFKCIKCGNAIGLKDDY